MRGLSGISMQRFGLYSLPLIAFALLGCEPSIGDPCESNIDCPAGTFCDSTSPDGYCTLDRCNDTTSCPEESVCVVFDRYNAFCMAECERDSDCRDGYVCRRDVGDAAFCYTATESDRPFVSDL